jgi:HD superfamily phosphohydrolase
LVNYIKLIYYLLKGGSTMRNNFNLEEMLKEREVVNTGELIREFSKDLYENLDLPDREKVNFDIRKINKQIISPFGSRAEDVILSIKGPLDYLDYPNNDSGIAISVKTIKDKEKEVQTIFEIIDELNEAKEILDRICDKNPSLDSINVSKNVNSSIQKAYLLSKSISIGEH